MGRISERQGEIQRCVDWDSGGSSKNNVVMTAFARRPCRHVSVNRMQSIRHRTRGFAEQRILRETWGVRGVTTVNTSAHPSLSRSSSFRMNIGMTPRPDSCLTREDSFISLCVSCDIT